MNKFLIKSKFTIKKFLKILVNKNIEKILLNFAFILFFILITTQIGLVSDILRPYLSDIEVFEGHVINEVDSLIQEGTVTLELVDISRENNVKILINGNEVSAFRERSVDIKVKQDSVIEIDGSRLKTNVTVRITSKSSNIISDIVGKEVAVQSNIKFLARIRLK